MNLLFLLRPHEDYRPLLELLVDVERRHEPHRAMLTYHPARASAERPTRRLDNEAAGARPTSKPAASHGGNP